MTQEERTQIRIRAAKILGYEEPITQSEDFTWYGHYGGARLKSPLPNCLENADDCLSLLVAILERRAKDLPVMREKNFSPEFGAWRFHIDYHKEAWVRLLSYRGGVDEEFTSDNPDAKAALMEAIAIACVAAFEAESSQEVRTARKPE